jgi:hypothetical protein
MKKLTASQATVAQALRNARPVKAHYKEAVCAISFSSDTDRRTAGDYTAWAAGDVWWSTCHQLAWMYRAHDPKFDIDTFYQACGYDEI